MLFTYEAITNTGEKKSGTIDAASKDLAIVAIQHRGYILSSITEDTGKKKWFNITIFEERIPVKDVVIMSRQIATLFESQVSAMKAFNLLAENTKNVSLAKILGIVAEDIRSGVSISTALSKHKEVFSDFYINMVKSGEETGKLTQTFTYLADYLDRQYQITSKTKNALIYPAFIIGVFFIVMVLMFTFIIPKISTIIVESGVSIPFFTKVILKVSEILVHYGIFILIGLIAVIVYLVQFSRTPAGKLYFDRLRITAPISRNIYTKLYLARIADNMDTMLSSSIPIVRAIELTTVVVGNRVYEDILKDIAESVKNGSSLSSSFSKHKEIPSIMSGMIKVGEETGSIGNILKTLGRFYTREVNEAIDTMVGLIEPILIIILGVGVGILLSSILLPIYNIAGGIQ